MTTPNRPPLSPAPVADPGKVEELLATPFSGFNAKPFGGLTPDETTVTTTTIGAARVEDTMPVCYRLVTKDDGNGNSTPVLQGYFTWTQGWNMCGGEWRDLETQDWLYAKDDVPFGQLFSNGSRGSR